MSEKVEDRIKELEERLANTKVNKATQKSINFIKAQLAKLREDLIRITSSKKGGGGGYGVRKSGDTQVAFIGFPSVGKSSLLNLLTEGDTHSKVAAYDFTTITAIPGMMKIEEAKKLQLGTEFVQGPLEGPVNLHVGDNLYKKVGGAEIIVKDGIIQEIRGI